MSGTREKLIELLDDIQRNGNAFCDIEIHGVRIPDTVGNDDVADHLIANGVTVQQWIPVAERLPEEHDSMFAKWYGTPLWKPGMFRTTSGDVLVCVEFGEGSKVVSTARTNAGEWNISSIFSGKVTHWMPLPNPPKEVRAVMPIQLKEVLYQDGHTVRELYEAMYLRGHDVTYKEIARYGRCHERDGKLRWKQIETCLREDFGIELPW